LPALPHAIQYLPAYLASPTLPLLFAVILCNQLGIPIPAIPLLLLAGAASAGTGAAWPAALAVTVVAAMLADCTWYFAGRRLGSRVLNTLCRISLSPDACVRQADSLFLRWGLRALLVAKFVPGVAAVATGVAGSLRAPPAKFIAYDAVGALLWASLWIAVGRLFHGALDDVIETIADFGRAGGLVILATIAVYILFRAARRQLFLRSLRMARIDIHELRAALAGSEPPIILDVRPALRQQSEGRIPGAITVAHLDEPVDRLQLPGDRDIVIYCACPNEASAAKLARRLRAAGITRVRPLAGGIEAWRAAGYPIE
jgi:membrane protein DedA with SNARE-associated domain/rhodanese-related sulfurtransferase